MLSDNPRFLWLFGQRRNWLLLSYFFWYNLKWRAEGFFSSTTWQNPSSWECTPFQHTIIQSQAQEEVVRYVKEIAVILDSKIELLERLNCFQKSYSKCWEKIGAKQDYLTAKILYCSQCKCYLDNLQTQSLSLFIKTNLHILCSLYLFSQV